MRRRVLAAVSALAVVAFAAPAASVHGTAVSATAAAKAPFSIDPRYTAKVENDYTTQFPSRWTNQVSGTAWRTSHDASANWIKDEWARLLQPFAAEGAFSELRPFNFLDPNGAGDNQD